MAQAEGYKVYIPLRDAEEPVVAERCCLLPCPCPPAAVLVISAKGIIKSYSIFPVNPDIACSPALEVGVCLSIHFQYWLWYSVFLDAEQYVQI